MSCPALEISLAVSLWRAWLCRIDRRRSNAGQLARNRSSCYFMAENGMGFWRPSMQSLNISLPESLKQFVAGQIAAGRYRSASEYVRELIRADEKRKAEERLETLLLEGLQSAETELTPADWSDIRQEAIAQVKARRPGR